MSAPEPSDLRASADRRPYATLLAKGEDRRQRILAVAERLLARNGWRNTSLALIAKEAGVTPAGLLHHFESKEQLLNAVLDARVPNPLKVRRGAEPQVGRPYLDAKFPVKKNRRRRQAAPQVEQPHPGAQIQGRGQPLTEP